MIQLTNNVYWDEEKEYNEQSNDCKAFIQNVIFNYSRESVLESIPNSNYSRVLEFVYTLDNSVKIKEVFTYKNSVSSSGWAELLNKKIECYAE